MLLHKAYIWAQLTLTVLFLNNRELKLKQAKIALFQHWVMKREVNTSDLKLESESENLFSIIAYNIYESSSFRCRHKHNFIESNEFIN